MSIFEFIRKYNIIRILVHEIHNGNLIFIARPRIRDL